MLAKPALLFSALLLAGACAQTAKRRHHPSSNDQPARALNRVIEDLRLSPINGPAFQLSDFKSAKAIVIVMREKDCPISEKYGLRLAHIEQKYAPKGVRFIYNYVGLVKTDPSARSDLSDFGFKGPYVIDSQRKTVDALGARTTGDVFVLTPERRVIYRGPVDDQFHLLKAAPNIKNNYLRDLLENIVSGRAIQPAERPAPGCFITRPLASVIYNKNKSLYILPNIPQPTALASVFYKGKSLPISQATHNPADIAARINSLPISQATRNPSSGGDVANSTNTAVWGKGFSSTRPAIQNKEETKPDIELFLLEPVKISPKRSFVYKTFLKKTDFKRDRWIKDIRFFLKPKAIHHAAIYIMDSSYRPSSGKLDHHTQALNMIRHTEFKSPPLRGEEKISSAGIRVPRGAKILWEIHYEPSGRALIDSHTRAEIYFHKEQPKYELVTHYYYTPDLNIPPHASDYMVKRSYRAEKQILLAGLNVHMHLRGKAASVFLIGPKGQRKRIFGLDPFNPHYESFYRFEKPLQVEKGSSVECLTWFDNSAGNPRNPAPEKFVQFGWSLEDEMSNCVFKELVPVAGQAKKRLFIRPFEQES